MRVVKPVVLERRVVTRARTDGPDLSARRSPKRGAVVDLFEDLVGLARILPDPNLDIEVLPVSIDEIRVSRRRRPGYRIVDRRLVEILGKLSIERPADLWKLLPQSHDWAEPFTTADIARRIDRPLWLAQRVAYCLRLSEAAQVVGKRGNHRSTNLSGEAVITTALECQVLGSWRQIIDQRMSTQRSSTRPLSLEVKCTAGLDFRPRRCRKGWSARHHLRCPGHCCHLCGHHTGA